MRAVFTSEPGGMERTRLQEVPEPNRGGPRILVEVRAAALNPADRFLIDGQYPGGPQPPFIVGRDASGVVLESDRPDEFPVGCRVLTLQSSATDLTNGTLCERQQFSPDVLTRIPVGWSFAEAAAAPLVFQTALQALTCAGELPSDGVVLVTGAGGGVGLAAVQLALAMKLRVVGLTRSADKRKRLQELGVPHVFAPDAEGLRKQILEAIGKAGVNLVVETVGGPLLTTAVHLLGQGGCVASLGVMAGVEALLPIPSLMFKQASVRGILVSGCSPADARVQWTKIVSLLNQNGRRPRVEAVIPLSDYEQAFARLAGSPFGKIVVDISLGGEKT